jgi:hypothetical protein
MGQPVVHFEIAGKDGDKLRGYYGELFGWEIDSDNPMSYGLVESLGGTRMMGPEAIMEGVEIGLLNDPEAHMVGVVKAVS